MRRDCIDGKVIRHSDGRKIRCPICLGRSAGKPKRSGPVEVTPYGIRDYHPPYCTCVDCVASRLQRQRGRKVAAPLAALTGNRAAKIGAIILGWVVLLGGVVAILMGTG